MATCGTEPANEGGVSSPSRNASLNWFIKLFVDDLTDAAIPVDRQTYTAQLAKEEPYQMPQTTPRPSSLLSNAPSEGTPQNSSTRVSSSSQQTSKSSRSIGTRLLDRLTKLKHDLY
ncbi:hypothetical protein HDU91_002015 [Kappamyces sp. JEL0680]|nr:hypothetical protein HDU91_002015 [Kappamyces sp. JEL0680]